MWSTQPSLVLTFNIQNQDIQDSVVNKTAPTLNKLLHTMSYTKKTPQNERKFFSNSSVIISNHIRAGYEVGHTKH